MCPGGRGQWKQTVLRDQRLARETQRVPSVTFKTLLMVSQWSWPSAAPPPSGNCPRSSSRPTFPLLVSCHVKTPRLKTHESPPPSSCKSIMDSMCDMALSLDFSFHKWGLTIKHAPRGILCITVNRETQVSHTLPAYNRYSMSVHCYSYSHTSFPSQQMR